MLFRGFDKSKFQSKTILRAGGKMPEKIYDTIAELIVDEASKYCFDEAWTSHLRTQGFLAEYFPAINKTLDGATEENRSLAIACAATEIGERLDKCSKENEPELIALKRNPDCQFGYASDSGEVQRSVYGRLISQTDLCGRCRKNESKCGIYSKDLMTNFYYVLKMAVAFLNPEKLKEDGIISQGTHFEIISPYDDEGRRYRETKCYTNLLSAYIDGLSEASASDDVIKNVSTHMNRFAERSSWLGNYTCLIMEIGQEESLNNRKGNVVCPLFLSDNKTIINDQFALFAEWVDENTTAEEQDMIDAWKKAMLLDGEVWELYRDAAEKYKSIWEQEPKDPENRLAAFAAYLELVNSAIELRSERIVRALVSND